ncbi:MAG TPA: SpoIIE family protein phosphatase [Gemmataceae bacterium]|nr:SpoIIE family protein phosphatase [Gemmataceae bacterium]
MSAHPPASILFVDDNDLACYGLIRALRQEGFHVLQASTGAEALKLVQQNPSLVILDVYLPDLSGFEVCRRIKTNPSTASIFVLHLSGHFISSEDRSEALEGGADGYLVKPVSPRELIAHVKAFLRIGQAERALHNSEARLQHILDYAPLLVHVKDGEGRYLLVNRLWEERFSLRRVQVVGHHIKEIFSLEQAEMLRTNDLKVLQADSPLEFEETIGHDENLRIYLSIKFPLHDPDGVPYAVCGISTDITERKRAEKALRDSEKLYHSLVETLPVCLFRKDRHGRIAFANQTFCSELKRPLEEIVGKTDLDLYPPELAEKYMCDDQRVIEAGEVFEDIEEHPGDETGKSYVRILKAPLYDSRQEVIGMQGIFWDITDRKRAEEELARTAAEFRIARSIQQKLFPTTTPEVAGMDIGSATYGFDIGGASYPAEAIGGDYYDYLPLMDGSLGVAIGDVSGHGIGPALLMAEVRAYLRAFAHMRAEPGDILDLVNRIILPDIEGDRFITLLLARLDPRRRSFVYSSAGHSTGYIFDDTGEIKRSLLSTSIPLGIMPDCDFPSSEPIALETGDLVLFLTDGIVEARAPDGTIFGTRRTIDMVRCYRHASARDIVENLYHAVRAYAQNQPQYDDITATVIKVGPAV